MKKFVMIIFLLVEILLSPLQYSPIYAEQIYYGRTLSTGIYLYSSPKIITEKTNKIFEIPVTYFVQILSEENDLFYRATYNGISGFVLKNEVACINAIPKTPYVATANFRVFTPSGAYLRSSPFESVGANNLITTIPFMETNLIYYGNCEGEEAIIYKGNIWYYCKYIKQNQEFYGYVYSALCDMLSPIAQNTEQFEYITPNFKEAPKEQVEQQYLTLNSPWHIIAILLISLPCIAIIYLLFKPTKIASQKNSNKHSHHKKEQKKISRLKHSDYYELDSDYFK